MMFVIAWVELVAVLMRKRVAYLVALVLCSIGVDVDSSEGEVFGMLVEYVHETCCL